MPKQSKRKQAKVVTKTTTTTTKKKATPKGPSQGSSRVTRAPVGIGRTNTMSKPMMVSSSNGDCRIRHREYLQDLTAEGTSPSLFKSEGFPINPGMSSTFPWLSQIAPRFEKYRFEKLHFVYETEAPTTLGGSLILTVDYDASDPAPGSKVQAMAYKNAVRSPPWEECKHVSSKDDLSQQKAYFVRSAPLADGDIKLYDTGNLFVCSQNVVTGNATLGELYVEYDVHLMTPQLQLPSTSGVGSTRVINGGTTTPALIFGASPAVQPDQSVFSYNSTTGVFTCLRAGSYDFSLYIGGTVITGLTWGGTNAAAVINAMSALIINSAGTFAASSATNGVNFAVGQTISFAASATTVSTGILCIGLMAVN